MACTRIALAPAVLLLLLASTAAASALPRALVPDHVAPALRSRVQDVVQVVPLSAASSEDFSVASAMVAGDIRQLPELLGRMPAGRLLQIPMTGFDELNLSLVPRRFAVCNVHAAAIAISEYVVGAVLSWNVQLPALDSVMRRCAWHNTPQPGDCPQSPVHTQSKGQTVGIVGYGSLGSGIAERSAALGMRVVAVTVPTPAVPPPPLAWVGNDTMLPRLMREADFVVVTCPMLPSTKGLVSAEAISHMKSSGVLINVARGPIVDEEGLYKALEGRSIGGAVLDVWWRDDWNSQGTWPSQFNFSSFSNVWMTPHVSYKTAGTEEEAVEQMASNLVALAHGKPLQNVIRPGAPGSSAPGVSLVI